MHKHVSADTEILVSVGYNSMNEHRKRIFNQLQHDNWKIASYIDPQAIVYTKDIGVGNIILSGNTIDFKTKIGNGNIFFNNNLLGHHSTVGDFNFFP